MSDSTQMPEALEAEEAILGAMIQAWSAIQLAEELELQAHHFYRPSHRILFDAMMQLRSEGEGCDELVLVQKLKAMPGGSTKRDGATVEVTALAAVGGAQVVMSLSERCPSVANSKAYVGEVLAAYEKRRLVEVGHQVAKVGYDTTMPAAESLKAAEQALLELVRSSGDKHTRGDAVDSDASLDRWAEAYQRRTNDELRKQDTLSWGCAALDERLGRMRGGQVFVPAGWTKHGKTWFVLDVAEAAMRQGARVLIDSGEMSDEELVDRWIAMGGHNYTSLQEGSIPWSVIAERRKMVKSWQRRTLTGRMTMARLRSQVSRAKLEGRPYRMVVVDHLGLMRPGAGEGRQGRREFVEDACAELKALAEEYGFVLLLVSQLSRPAPVKEAHERYLRPPIQSDLKEASGIEQIATSVIFVYRKMVKQTGRFDGQMSYLLFPFHRSRPTPDPLTCEFVLPSRPSHRSVSAYRFEPVTIEPTQPTVETVALQEKLTDSFGPGVTIVPSESDDMIPF